MPVDYKTITILDNYTIKRDGDGWMLNTKTMVMHHGKKKPAIKQTYYGQLEHVCKAIIDRECGNCESLEQIIELLTKATTQLTKEVELAIK